MFFQKQVPANPRSLRERPRQDDVARSRESNDDEDDAETDGRGHQDLDGAEVTTLKEEKPIKGNIK